MNARRAGRKALGLYGGGLDSRLAFRMMRDRIDGVEGLHFETGFVRPSHRAEARAARERGEIEIVDVRQRYLQEVLAAPRHGYGSGMNPCHDCRAFMLARAGEIAAGRGIDLLFTGDVVGQRAHDQSHAAFRTIDREAGLAGRVLRPLSERHLDSPDCPGEGGDLQGRSRRRQLAWAEAWGERGWPQPSGRCCRLADPAFARRVRDYLAHCGPRGPRAEEIPLLAAGRHFRLGWNLKVVLSRNAADARAIDAAAPSGLGRLRTVDVPGPEGCVEAERLDAEAAADVAALVAGHTPAGRGGEVAVEIELGGERRVVRSVPAGEGRLARWRI